MQYDANKVIALAFHNRPEYSARVLDSILAAEGSDEYLVLVSAEPCDDGRAERSLTRMVEAWPHRRTYAQVQRYHHGCTPNMWDLLQWAYAYGEFVIYLEDMNPIAPDALRFYEYCRQEFEGDAAIDSVSGYSQKEGDAYEITTRTAFVSWGQASWRGRWRERIKPALLYHGENQRYGTDDIGVGLQVYPALSRVQHIGADLTAYGACGSWEGSTHTSTWAGNVVLPPFTCWRRTA